MGVRGFCISRVSAFLLICLFLLSTVQAVNIGVNKGRINYVDVLQNGYAQENVLVTTDSPTEIAGTYEVEGEIAPWLTFEPSERNFTFSREHPYPLTVIVTPPADAQLGDYSGGLRFLTGELQRNEGGKIGQTTRAAFLIRLGLGVTGTQRLDCAVGGLELKDTEQGQPIDFVATVSNKGNVRIKPAFDIKVYDQAETLVLQKFSFESDKEILPTTSQKVFKQLEHGLIPGQYFARVEIPLCGETKRVTFDVLERGGIADKGTLLRIDAPSWAKTGDILPVDAVFQNQGSRTVEARFEGTITPKGDEKIVKVIDTAPLNVLPGETTKLETFFNPITPGTYVINGRVRYNNKLTFQKQAIINVNGSALEFAGGLSGSLLVMLLLLIVILILLILIAKRRRRRRW